MINKNNSNPSDVARALVFILCRVFFLSRTLLHWPSLWEFENGASKKWKYSCVVLFKRRRDKVRLFDDANESLSDCDMVVKTARIKSTSS